MPQFFNLRARILDLGFRLLLAADERGNLAAPLLQRLRQLADALLQRLLLLAERRRKLLLRRERDLALGERGVGGVALLAEIFQFRRERGDFFLAGAFARFEFVQLRRQRVAFLQTFLLLRGEALDFKNDRLDFLVQQPVGILQRVELALARGDGDFLLAQFRLRLLQRRLQFGLLAQQRAAFAAHLGHAVLERGQFILQIGNLILAAQNGARRLGIAVAVQIAAGVNAVTAQQIALQRDEIAARVAVLDLRRRGRQIRRDERAAEQRLQKPVHRRVRLDDAQRVDNLAAIQGKLRRRAGVSRRHVAVERQLVFILVLDGQSRDARAAGLVRAQFGDDFLRGFGLLGQDELQVMAQRIFNRHDKLLRHADAIRQRADDRTRLAQRRDRAGIKTFARAFELLQHAQARAFLGLRLQKLVLLGGGFMQFLLKFAQPVLPLLHGAARGRDVQFFHLDARGEFLQSRFQAGALDFQVGFSRRKVFRGGCCCPASANRAR